MFKNIFIYQFGGWPETSALRPFSPCGPTQATSSGWEPPADGDLIEQIGCHSILLFTTEKKVVPAQALKRAIEERSAAIERETGRKPGRRQLRDLKDQLILEMLPQAFAKRSSHWVWVAPDHDLCVIEASSQSAADTVATALCKEVNGISLNLAMTEGPPAATMATWLCDPDTVPADISIDRELELKSTDEMKSVVKYGRHPLDIAEVRGHIEGGKRPTKLALTWRGRVSFVLTAGLQLKKLEFLDVAFENHSTPAGEPMDEGFYADAAIATGELANLIKDLFHALGGQKAVTQ